MAVSAPFRGALLPLCLLGTALLPACAAPPASSEHPRGLEAPVPSPPGGLPAAERLAWWERQLPRLRGADRSEARLCMGDLHLDLGQPQEARFAYFEALGGELSAVEAAHAERGIGLSYFLQGNARLGARHLASALAGLEGPAAQEAAYLLAAAKGEEAAPVDAAMSARMQPYLDAAALRVREAAVAPGRVDIAREDWGAAPMRANHDPMERPWRITVHHTAEPLTSTSRSATCAEVRDVQRMHFARGWADVGYHFLIDRAGRVVAGRPVTVQGAHAGDHEKNRGNLGICVLGNFVAQPARGPEYARPQAVTEAQWEALDRLVSGLRDEYGIPAARVYAHHDFTGTQCPGPALKRWVRRHRSVAP